MIVAVVAVTAAVAYGAPAKTSHTKSSHSNMVFVKGGTFKNTHSNYYGKGVTVSSFYIGRYLVTEKEWDAVMPSDPSKVKGANLPVEMVTWYDAVEYCNRRSLKEGLKPYYNIDKAKKDPNNKPDPTFGDLDKIKWTVTTNPGANGYRLPTEAEWEYAAEGGQLSRNYVYSGSNDPNVVSWYWKNSGDRVLTGFWSWPAIQGNNDGPKPVGLKKPNELGLYDMSGNVREWCWDWYSDHVPTHVKNPEGPSSGYKRIWRGGGWMGEAMFSKSAFRGSLAANGAGPDQGFRVCRNSRKK